MKTLSRIVALAVTATALVATAAPAHAVGESTVNTSTAYVGDNCIDQPVNYSVNIPAGSSNWSLEIDAIYPDGVRRGSASILGTFKGSPLAGTTTIQICGKSEPTGTWTLQPTVTSGTTRRARATTTRSPARPPRSRSSASRPPPLR